MKAEEFKNMINHCKRLNVGDKIKFKSEKQRYTIKAKSDRYLICTKPFNLQKTVLYTIIDAEENIRGTNYLIFNCYDYAKDEDIQDCLSDLISGKLEISRRNRIELDIELQ